MHNALSSRLSPLFLCFGMLLLSALVTGPVKAEIRTVSATGEYRMGDNDNRTDAKRLALLDAKRLALEQVGVYLENVTAVKNFQVSRDDIRTFTAGLVEVKEQATRTVLEGDTTVVRVDVTVQVNAADVARQIDELRRNESAKDELMRARQEADRLRAEVQAKTKELASLKSKKGSEAIVQQRQQVLAQVDVNDLLTQAWRVPNRSREEGKAPEALSPQERARARAALDKALALDPANPQVHLKLGHLEWAEGHPQIAAHEYREAIRLNHGLPWAHLSLGRVLAATGQRTEAAQHLRFFLQLVPQTPANRPVIERVQAKLPQLER